MAIKPFRNRVLALLLAIVGLTLSSEAGQVIWRTAGNSANLTSQGTRLTSSFLFALGAFEDGFVPTASNVAEWAANWQTASVAPYDETTGLASSIFRYTANRAPFTTVTRGYLWGFDAEASEWVLLTHPNWKWPVASQLAFPVVWATNTDGVAAIVGQVQTDETHLTTASTTGNTPILLPETWSESKFSESERNDPSIAGWLADPDGDGLSNLAEYGLDGDPMRFDAAPSLTITPIEGTDASYELTLLLNQSRLVQASLEYSYDAQFWFPEGAQNVQTVDNLADQQTVRVSSTGPLNQFFARVTCQWLDGINP